VTIGLVLESTAHWVAMGTSSEELIVRGDELAARLGARVSDHVAGGTMSRESGYLRFMLEMGRTDIEFLHGLGVLDRKWVLAHAIHARDRDIELIAADGAAVAHTPTSESSRGGGITPIKRFRDAGILVSLGSDGPMVDTSVDMVEQMKAAIMFQNQLHRDPLALTPYAALAMTTCDAAEALGLAESLGSLEPGKRADVAVFDLENPSCGVWHDPVAALVHSRAGLRALLVDGEPLVRDGVLTRITADEVGEVLAEARQRAEELLGRTDVPAAARASEGRAALEAIV
jgi:5-methylthioadenosine/S-adenosylhomocysteine deaminase